MITAIIGTGGLGSVIARRLASGGETLRLSSADNESARTLAAEIGRAAVVAVDNRDVLHGADAVVLALRFTVLKGVIDEIAGPLAGKLVVVPSNPLTIDAQGNVSRVLPEGQSSGEVVAGWLPTAARLAMAFGTLSAELFESSSNRSPEPAVLFYATDDDRAGEEVERLIRTAGFEPVKVGGIAPPRSGRYVVRSAMRARSDMAGPGDHDIMGYHMEAQMTDVLIRDIPDDVIAALDAHAARLGLSRSEYVRRRLAQDAATPGSPVSVTDLARFASTFADLADPDVMSRAWT